MILHVLVVVVLALMAGGVDAAEHQLCINGHPAPREHGVTYGGLLPKHGFQRDHIVPLCLGGPDMPANVQYQPIDEALRKDVDEWRLCEAHCRGEISVPDAIDELDDKWPR